MAHFYGTVKGSRGEATRCGGAHGLVTKAAGWRGAIRTVVYSEDGQDRFRVELIPWQGSGGQVQLLAEGLLDAEAVYQAPKRPKSTKR